MVLLRLSNWINFVNQVARVLVQGNQRGKLANQKLSGQVLIVRTFGQTFFSTLCGRGWEPDISRLVSVQEK